jgi:hypothetical protein
MRGFEWLLWMAQRTWPFGWNSGGVASAEVTLPPPHDRRRRPTIGRRSPNRIAENHTSVSAIESGIGSS